MSLKKGLARAGRTLDSPQKSLGGVITNMTLDNPAGWLTAEDAVGLSRDRAMKISTVNRCVEVLSNSMAVLPVYIMDERSKERLKDHRLGRVLWGRANEAMTTFDYQRLMLCNQLFRGNAYAWIYRDPSSGHPLELLPLPPDYVTPMIDTSGHLWYFFTHPVTGEITQLRPDNILHYKAYSEDGIEGISVLKRASLTLDTARAAQQYENSTWRSGGQPSGILTTESDLGGNVERMLADGTKIMVDPKEELRKSWDSVHKGPGNAMRVAVLDLGLKYQPISMTNTDAQFVESSELRVADVCRFFGVPLHLAYAGKQSYQSNEQNGIEFVNYTLLAYETQWGQEDTYKLLLPGERAKNLRIKRELKVFLKGDTTAQAAWYRVLREISGLNANEIRALEDMGNIPGGDSYYASWGYGPLDQWSLLSVIRALGKASELNLPEGSSPKNE
ncbi:phage portal protein [Oscillibacter sp.]|uniref:phage portal protein n=1 Tax=Oscillibacter sp. TaxID=1945593 RepID=UPI00339B5474